MCVYVDFDIVILDGCSLLWILEFKLLILDLEFGVELGVLILEQIGLEPPQGVKFRAPSPQKIPARCVTKIPTEMADFFQLPLQL